MLVDKHISDFQKLYLEEFGISISQEEAAKRGSSLIELIHAIYKPVTKEDYKKYNNTYAPRHTLSNKDI